MCLLTLAVDGKFKVAWLEMTIAIADNSYTLEVCIHALMGDTSR
ncbi:hypothetical protein [Fischerella sp. PCC 9605]|nr:hypothetical protein [Fischerella sp. PCC 9605]